ncbi:MAG TPA: cytidine deaminase [Candidatus Merdenecus merdavium]|nr:cytidine deaminase [Candidatus Merdenecus merdavium]
MDRRDLAKKAIEAMEYSYSPYSNFTVGVALLGKSGKVYSGCNVENAAYSPTNCGERTAFFKAVSEGETEFKGIAIAGKSRDQKEIQDFCSPCGVCRQVMAEFCSPEEFKIILVKNEQELQEYLLKDLLPLGFTKDQISI